MPAADEPRFATVDLVRSYAYGVDIPSEFDAEVAALIMKAERRLLRRAPSILARVEDGRLTEDDVADVVADMVLRVIRNPGGYSSEQAGEFSYRVDWAAASGRIQVTREDLANLGIGTRRGLPGSIRLKTPRWRLP